MAKRSNITYKGGGRGRDPERNEFEFDGATFERLQKDLQAGKRKATAGRIWVHDNMITGLRALVGKREISYHAQITIRDKKTGAVAKRTTMTVGSYPEDSPATARDRTRVVQAQAEEGNDPRGFMRQNLLNYLDEVRVEQSKRETLQRTVANLADAGVDVEALNERLLAELKKAKGKT